MEMAFAAPLHFNIPFAVILDARASSSAQPAKAGLSMPSCTVARGPLAVFAAALGGRALTRQRRRACRLVRRQITEKSSYQDRTLPQLQLSAEELEKLQSGHAIRRQHQEGHKGSGIFVVDVDAPAHVVLDCLKSFEEYEHMIPVVRKADVNFRESSHNLMMALVDYKISKFWLNVSVIHKVNLAAGTVHFDLDCTNTNIVLKEASGCWRVEPLPGDQRRCRVSLEVSLRASRLILPCLVDYAAQRALNRATFWLKPYVEEVSQEMQGQTSDIGMDAVVSSCYA